MGFRVGIKGDLRDFGLSLWALVGLGACGISDFRLGLAPGFGLGACGISGFRFRVGTKGELWDFGLSTTCGIQGCRFPLV